jgi:hypothetical protein
VDSLAASHQIPDFASLIRLRRLIRSEPLLVRHTRCAPSPRVRGVGVRGSIRPTRYPPPRRALSPSCRGAAWAGKFTQVRRLSIGTVIAAFTVASTAPDLHLSSIHPLPLIYTSPLSELVRADVRLAKTYRNLHHWPQCTPRSVPMVVPADFRVRGCRPCQLVNLWRADARSRTCPRTFAANCRPPLPLQS